MEIGVALRLENRDGVIGVLLLVRRDGTEDLAETPRRNVRYSGVAREREGFQHDLLDDEAADGVALCDAAHESLAEPLPMFSVDIADDVHSDLPACGREGGGVRLLDGRMLPCLVGLFGIVTDLGQGGVIHGGDELARHRLGQHVLPNRSGRRGTTLRLWLQLHQGFHQSSSRFQNQRCYRYV